MRNTASARKKASGVDWIGQIPAHWQVRSFRYCGVIPNGQVDPRLPQFREQTLVAPNHIESGTGRLLGTETTDEQGAESGKYVFEAGNVLYSKIRPELAKVCLIDFHGLCSADMYPIAPRSDVNAGFLAYQMICTGLTESVVLTSARVAMPKVNRDELGGIPLVIPSLAEQQALAAFKDRKTAQIDAVVAKKQRLIERLQEKLQALISHAVTKGLNPNAPMKDSGIEWLGEIPAHWTFKRLKRISPRVGVGLVINPSTYVKDEGVPFLFGGDIQPGKILVDKARRMSDEDSRKLPQSRLMPNDLVTVRVGYPGVTAVVPTELEGANCASVMVIRGAKSFVSRWLCYAMNSTLGSDQINVVKYGAAQEQFNISHAVEFIFPVPPKEEQLAIADHLESEFKRMKDIEESLRMQITKLQEYRQTLISAAVTGKIDVTKDAAP